MTSVMAGRPLLLHDTTQRAHKNEQPLISPSFHAHVPDLALYSLCSTRDNSFLSSAVFFSLKKRDDHNIAVGIKQA